MSDTQRAGVSDSVPRPNRPGVCYLFEAGESRIHEFQLELQAVCFYQHARPRAQSSGEAGARHVVVPNSRKESSNAAFIGCLQPHFPGSSREAWL